MGAAHRAPPHRNRQPGDGVESQRRKTAPIVAAGAAAAASPAALASAVDVVITILTDACGDRRGLSRPRWAAAGAVAGKLFIEMSTVRPQIEVALAAKVRAAGAAFVECPVGGTTGPARQGKLIGPVGAQEAMPPGRGRFSISSAGASILRAGRRRRR